jgi:hypothetical protein
MWRCRVDGDGGGGGDGSGGDSDEGWMFVMIRAHTQQSTIV